MTTTWMLELTPLQLQAAARIAAREVALDELTEVGYQRDGTLQIGGMLIDQEGNVDTLDAEHLAAEQVRLEEREREAEEAAK